MLAIFDIGETLVSYEGVALNWTEHYSPAILTALKELKSKDNKNGLELSLDVLSFYNTRKNPRKFEISEGEVTKKIANLLNIDELKFEDLFFQYFQRRSILESTAKETLRKLKNSGVSTASLTDCAYGMPKRIIKNDISTIYELIDRLITSCEIGERKPSPKGIEILKKEFNKKDSEVYFIGNEIKDIECAKNAKVKSILIDPSGKKDFGQDYSVKKLSDVLRIIL